VHVCQSGMHWHTHRVEAIDYNAGRPLDSRAPAFINARWTQRALAQTATRIGILLVTIQLRVFVLG
jgi:hypothetical protein